MSRAEQLRSLSLLLAQVVAKADARAREQLRDLEAITAEGVEIPTTDVAAKAA